MIFFSDFDGVWTPKFKLCSEEEVKIVGTPIRRIRVSKLICDHDCDAANFLKDEGHEFIIISNDRRVNETWANDHGFKFLFGKNDKCQVICEYLRGKDDKRFVYIGDAIPDAKAMLAAYRVVIPSDASEALGAAIRAYGESNNFIDVIECPKRGGDGVIDWMAANLHLFTS